MKQGVDNVRFNFLYVDKYSFGRTWVYPESIVPYNMLRYIRSGAATFFIDDKELSVEKNKSYMFQETVNYRVMHRLIIFLLQVYGLPHLYFLKEEIFWQIIMEFRL